MSDKWGILPIPTSPQMRINIPILQVKMKYFDLFYSTDQKIFSTDDDQKPFFLLCENLEMRKVFAIARGYSNGKNSIC